MSATINAETISKGVEAVANMSRIGANLTKNMGNNQPQQQPKKPDNMNQPHNQTVEVKVGDTTGNNGKPFVLKEKNETHIHKPFPDNRELSERECEVEKLRITKEYEDKDLERKYKMALEELNRQERKEREAYEREKEEYARKERKKNNTRFWAVVGGLTALGLGTIAYDYYSNSRNVQPPVQTTPKLGRPSSVNNGVQKPAKPIKVEGTVK